jgi:hypothetical protein
VESMEANELMTGNAMSPMEPEARRYTNGADAALSGGR